MKLRPLVDWKKRASRCNGCGHDMSAIAGLVCPECGRDVSKYTAWSRDGTWSAHTLAPFAFGAGLLVGGVQVAVFSLDQIPNSTIVALMLTGLIFSPIAISVWASQRFSRRMRNFLWRYALVGGAYIIAYSLVIGVWIGAWGLVT